MRFSLFIIPYFLCSVLHSQDSVSLTIQANNLAEDFTLLSSQKDEIQLVVLNDSFIVHSQYFEMTKDSDTFQTNFQTQDPLFQFFLVERDSYKTNSEIDSIILRDLKTIRECYTSRKYSEIYSILGNDDLIGFASLKSDSLPESILFDGVHLFDRFIYEIFILNVNQIND